MAIGYLDSQVIAAAQTITTTTELAVVTLSPGAARTQPVGQGLVISGTMNVTQGTAGTALTVRVREGANTITGTVVGVARVHTVAAAALAQIPFTELDAVVVDGQYYTVTVQATAATGNGTVNGGCAMVTGATADE